MLLIAVIVLLVLYNSSRTGTAPVGELWFMMSAFAGLAYVAGFLDSRLFARLDKNKANMLAEAEARYEANIAQTPVAPARSVQATTEPALRP